MTTVEMRYLQVAANLMNDDELMLSAQLTPTVRPFVDFVADFSDQQYHRGWVFGYADVSGQNVTRQVQPPAVKLHGSCQA